MVRASWMWLTLLAHLENVVAMPLEGSPECPCVNPTDPSYGSGCRAHDVNGTFYPECVSATPRPWCGDMWCYVNRSNCLVTNEVSASGGVERFWSYTTCGYRDLFSLANITESIRGQTLRVIFIGNTGGWKGNYCSERGQICINQRGQGTTQRIFDTLTHAAGFSVDARHEVSQAVREQMSRVSSSSSQFDLCTWATGVSSLLVNSLLSYKSLLFCY